MLLDRVRPALAERSPGLLGSRGAGRTAAPAPVAPTNSTALTTWLRNQELAEAFFSTMSSLRFAMERGTQANIIVLTSRNPVKARPPWPRTWR